MPKEGGGDGKMIEEQVLGHEVQDGEGPQAEELKETKLDMHERVPTSSGDLDESHLVSEMNPSKSVGESGPIVAEGDLDGVSVEPCCDNSIDGTPIDTEGKLAGDDAIKHTIDQDTGSVLDGSPKSPKSGIDHPVVKANPDNEDSEDTSESSLVGTKRKSNLLLTDALEKKESGSTKKIKQSPQKQESFTCQNSATPELDMHERILTTSGVLSESHLVSELNLSKSVGVSGPIVAEGDLDGFSVKPCGDISICGTGILAVDDVMKHTKEDHNLSTPEGAIGSPKSGIDHPLVNTDNGDSMDISASSLVGYKRKSGQLLTDGTEKIESGSTKKIKKSPQKTCQNSATSELDMHERIPASSGESHLVSELNPSKSVEGSAPIVAEGDLDGVSVKLCGDNSIDGTPMDKEGKLAGDDVMKHTKEDQNLSTPEGAVHIDQDTSSVLDDSPKSGIDHPIVMSEGGATDIDQNTSSVLDGSPKSGIDHIVKPDPDNGDSKDTSASSLVGTKRKSDQLLTAATEKKESGSTKKIKKSPQKWECSTCQISVTSEQHLKDHLQGKKHKSKVAKLTTSSSVDSSSSTVTDTNTNTNSLAQPVIPTLPAEKHEKEDVATKPNKNNAAAPYWCEICSVGTNSEPQMAIHQKGKKHISMAAKTGLPKQQFQKNENIVETKPKPKKAKTEVLAKVSPVKKKEVVAAGVSCDDVGVPLRPQKMVMKFFCKTCDVTMYDEGEMDGHRKSEKHMGLLKKNRGALIVVSNAYMETAEHVEKEGCAIAAS